MGCNWEGGKGGRGGALWKEVATKLKGSDVSSMSPRVTISVFCID